MKLIQQVLLALSVLCGSAFGQKQHDLSQLPAHIKGEVGKVSLVADFEHPEKSGVPVYLINQSEQDLELEHEDSDVYLKLEYMDSQGEWKRAQSHLYSRCGNSFFPGPPLYRGLFMKFFGYVPEGGEAATIRYKLYQQRTEITSQPAPGFLVKSEIRKAANDEMVVRGGNFAFVAAVALGTQKLPNFEGSSTPRTTAIWSLRDGRFEREQVEEVLTKIATDEQGGEYPVQAQAALEELRKAPRVIFKRESVLRLQRENLAEPIKQTSSEQRY